MRGINIHEYQECRVIHFPAPCDFFPPLYFGLKKQTNQLFNVYFFYEEHKIPCEYLYKCFRFFYEEQKILCQCLYKCFLVFMRSIKYLVNVYGSVSFFFMRSIKYLVNVYTSVSFFLMRSIKYLVNVYTSVSSSSSTHLPSSGQISLACWQVTMMWGLMSSADTLGTNDRDK